MKSISHVTKVVLAISVVSGGLSIIGGTSAFAATKVSAPAPQPTPSPRPGPAPTPAPVVVHQPSAVPSLVSKVTQSSVAQTIQDINQGLSQTGLVALAGRTVGFFYPYVKAVAYVWIFGE